MDLHYEDCLCPFILYEPTTDEGIQDKRRGEVSMQLLKTQGVYTQYLLTR